MGWVLSAESLSKSRRGEADVKSAAINCRSMRPNTEASEVLAVVYVKLWVLLGGSSPLEVGNDEVNDETCLPSQDGFDCSRVEIRSRIGVYLPYVRPRTRG